MASVLPPSCSYPAGLVLDRYGRTPVAVLCLGLLGAGLGAMAAVPHGALVAFVAAALIVGLGDGVGLGLIKTLGIDLAPEVGRARFLGWWTSLASVRSFAGPALATGLIAGSGLGAALLGVGGLGLFGSAWLGSWTARLIPRRPSA